MKNIKTILVPTDFSETAANAFRYAVWFADQFSAQIKLLHTVYPEIQSTDYPVMVGRATKERLEVANELMKAFINNGVQQVKALYPLPQMPEITSSVMIGTAPSLIADQVEEENIDLVIMGKKGEHDALEKTFGSVTTTTMRKSVCPVLIIPEDASFGQIRSIIFATDLSESDPYHIWEAGKLLHPFSSIMRVVHIQKESIEEKDMTINELENFFADHAPMLQTTFHSIAASKVSEELNELAMNWKSDLLIMYQPSRGFFERIFHKSMTFKTALDVEVPLLILK